MSSSSTIELRAPAKLNLFLEVLQRRPDGYHEIDSVLQTIDLADTVHIERADTVELEVSGDAPDGPGNLAWRAADLLQVGARIRLTKRIPPGAGLGGGSSDAAAVLQGLNRLYGLGRSRAQLADLGASLGADVPFFLHGGAARCRGIGERVERVQVPAARYLLVLPPIELSTERVYGALEAPLTPPRKVAKFLSEIDFGKEGPSRATFFNRLQEAAEGLEPRLGRLREEAGRAYGAHFTMTGSGSAYFAPFGSTDSPSEGWLQVDGMRCRVCSVRTLDFDQSAAQQGERRGDH